MSDPRASTYSATGGHFSAADAYAQYEAAAAAGAPAEAPSTSSAAAAPGAATLPSSTSTRRQSQVPSFYGQQAAQSSAGHRRTSTQGSGLTSDFGGRDTAGRTTPGTLEERRHQSEGDDEDEDDDEDWNVYDDFNNNAPAFRTDTPAGGSNYAGSDAGYFQKSAGDGASTPGLTPFGDYPSRQVPAGQQRGATLIPADSFGFDARNADPRHLSFQAHNAEDDGMGGLHPAEPHTVAGHDPDKNESGIELVTVPALGQEFTKEEMKRMSRPYKKKEKVRRRKEAAKRWGKGEYKIWGWLNPRVAVFLAFIFLVLLGITLYFVIPRVPSIAFLTTDPLEAYPDAGAMETHYSPTNFSMTMKLNLRGSNTGGWIPTHVNSMNVEVTELTTMKQIGTGKLSGITFPGRKKKVFQLPVNFAYRSLNVSGDATFQAVHDACYHKYPNTARPNLNLSIKLTMKIAGLLGKKVSTTNINTACPFELDNAQ